MSTLFTLCFTLELPSFRIRTIYNSLWHWAFISFPPLSRAFSPTLSQTSPVVAAVTATYHLGQILPLTPLLAILSSLPHPPAPAMALHHNAGRTWKVRSNSPNHSLHFFLLFLPSIFLPLSTTPFTSFHSTLISFPYLL